MRSNCIVVAMRLYRKKIKERRPVGREPYLMFRPARSKNAVGHMLVGEMDASGMVRIVASFKPDLPHDVPLWMAWTRLLFTGTIQQGDVYSRPGRCCKRGKGKFASLSRYQLSRNPNVRGAGARREDW